MWFLGVQITILEKIKRTRSARDVRTATFKHDNNIWSLLGKELWTFAALAGVLCDSIVVDELPTCLAIDIHHGLEEMPMYLSKDNDIDKEEKGYLVK